VAIVVDPHKSTHISQGLYQILRAKKSSKFQKIGTLKPGTWNLRIISSKFQKFQAPKIGTLEPGTWSLELKNN
jgi:hypothetical protein